ncbi:hypothetical protein Dalk_4534 [Desulfatibacillum aliphaticivorans]|uniref:Uncharacterized protein n=1 Tax=Desulfatibacillum aliphaticivorans TaxID=218208 RepID=B8FCP9_DESAL|nr:hypothetical protein [Desulfatibacillum aliphaticivorans]ACL06212.1 hypothetical protein Dalk_4534 [Desulfatibacillum aliphaticivorans]
MPCENFGPWIVCGNRPVKTITHKGRRWSFEFTPACGWTHVKQNGMGGDDRRVPKAVWEKLEKET